MFRKNSRILPGGSSTRSGPESLARQSEMHFPDIDNGSFSKDNATSVFSATAPARLVRDLAFLNEPGDPKAEPMLKEPSPRGALGGRITPAELAAQARATSAAALASDAAQVTAPSLTPGSAGTVNEKPLDNASSLAGAPKAIASLLASSINELPPLQSSSYKTGNDILADIMGLEYSLKERYSVNGASKQQQPPSSASYFASSAEADALNPTYAVSVQLPFLDGLSHTSSRAGAELPYNSDIFPGSGQSADAHGRGSANHEASSLSELSASDLASNDDASAALQMDFMQQQNSVKKDSSNFWGAPGTGSDWANAGSNGGRKEGPNRNGNERHNLISSFPPDNSVKQEIASSSGSSWASSAMHTSKKEQDETRNPLPNKVKGVSTGVMHVPGLLDSLKSTANNSSSSSSGGDVLLRFANAPHVTPEDGARLAAELSFGTLIGGAIPWVSIESTHDRAATRVVALHPAYRNTLVGYVFTELDTALKAVGGTARGGLFLDANERQKFLEVECEGRSFAVKGRGESGGGEDWGPNGQKRPPPHLGDVQAVQKLYPSFTLSDAIFGGDEVSQWRQQWESVWKDGDTGMDISGQLSKLDLYPSTPDHRHHNEGRSSDHGDSSRSNRHATVAIEVHSRWGVALHTDDVKDLGSQSSSPSSELQAVKEQGEALCSRLMPKVPIPKPLYPDAATEGTSRPSAWTPPQGQHTLAYLYELLNMITGLLSVLETAKIDLPHLLPTDALESALQQQSLGSSSSSSHQPRWRHCATPRRIPFEPAIDRESGALFLGGGVGIAAAPKGVLCRKRQTMATPVQPGTCGVVMLSLRLPTSKLQQSLDQATAAIAPQAEVFLHQVAALGLWSNYSTSHPSAHHPRTMHVPPSTSSNQHLSTPSLVQALLEVLPDGYCRRSKKLVAQVARDELEREDVAHELNALNPEGTLALQAQAEKAQKLRAKGIKQMNSDNDGVVSVAEDEVELFNGDKYTGRWALGRRHGKGVYVFATGARYEGEWAQGTMVGWGVLIDEDGTRRNIRHR